MFLRLTRGRFDPAHEEDVKSAVKPVIDAFRELPGLLRYTDAINHELGLFVALTYWDTQEHASFDRALLGDSIVTFTKSGVTLEPSEIYEVDTESD